MHFYCRATSLGAALWMGSVGFLIGAIHFQPNLTMTHVVMKGLALAIFLPYATRLDASEAVTPLMTKNG